ncbi:bestrophin family protein [[Limnothrix rosea] IAM M-220]|uniref:bestrophin family protein n=1 Tax=[Limnothrix rosea] IAM M-220 TaxID=454133 RepID=UPI00095C5249|nr:bestrophin family ion channel [[Limnothrix rosea] IAM M-220]OKH19748.1 hypothetical protein NIES208_01055 [[Limnothrix rosea] IAM M-220]
MLTQDKFEKSNWLSTVFQLQGSVVLMILPRIFFFCGFTATVTFLYIQGRPIYLEKLGDLTTNVIYNLVLGLLIVFRTNTSYDRFWEGRKAWGSIVVNSRNLAQEIRLGVRADHDSDQTQKQRALKLISAFAIATKLHLRGAAVDEDLKALTTKTQAEKLAESEHRPFDIQFWLRSYLSDQLEAQKISDGQYSMVSAMLNDLMGSVSSCERILTTPIPITYRMYLKRLILIYCFGLPFRIIPDLTWWSVPITGVVSFLLLGIEEVARELENPFGFNLNDLPLDDLCKVIGRDVEHIAADERPDSATFSEKITV